jgi:hypothetical protein
MPQIVEKIVLRVIHPFLRFKPIFSIKSLKGKRTPPCLVSVFFDQKAGRIVLFDKYSGLMSSNFKWIEFELPAAKYFCSLLDKALGCDTIPQTKNRETLVYERSKWLMKSYSALAGLLPKENSKTCFHMWSHPKKFWSLAFIEVSEIMKPMGIKLIEVSYILGTSFHPMGGSWYLLTENDALRLRDALFFLCSPKLDGDQG